MTNPWSQMMMPPVDLRWEDAYAVRDAVLADVGGGVELVPPTDPRRVLILATLSLVHSFTHLGWSYEHAERNVSVTVPPLPPLAVTALSALAPAASLAGQGAALLGGAFQHTLISLAPEAYETPVRYVSRLCHEASHAYAARDGLFALCTKYARAETRVLEAEEPGYACDVAWELWTAGLPPADTQRAQVLADAAQRWGMQLKGYGANDEQVKDIQHMLRGHAETVAEGLCPPVRALMVAVRTLNARGVAGLPTLPASPR